MAAPSVVMARHWPALGMLEWRNGMIAVKAHENRALEIWTEVSGPWDAFNRGRYYRACNFERDRNPYRTNGRNDWFAGWDAEDRLITGE